MTLKILQAGLQTTVQAAPRTGQRHWGVPWSGPADSLSCSLANAVIGNTPDAAALEITYGQFRVRFDTSMRFALMGAPAPASLDGGPVAYGQPVDAAAGATLTLAAPAAGVRTYLALAGGISVPAFMGSQSTYPPASLGGHEGRALIDGDRLALGLPPANAQAAAIPKGLHVTLSDHWRLRLHPGPDVTQGSELHRQLYTEVFSATRRADRMGIQIEGPKLGCRRDDTMDSVPVFPGTVQVPPDGKPFILLCDAQTTGGYPRLGHIARVDRHKLGQVRPGDRVQFLEVSAETARRAFAAKQKTLKDAGLENALF
ncbi:MAG: biotin-dependent carboxyltransferase family protein [Pseudomonadota bacterium]